MVDLLRPEPRSSPGQRLGRVLGAVSVARLATGAGAVLLVAVTAWWLLRSPAPPVERSLPSARTTAVHASRQGRRRRGGRARPRPAFPWPPARRRPKGCASVPGELAWRRGHDGGARSGRPSGRRRDPARRLPPAERREGPDVVTAAGGPSADADLQAVALAARVTDGARVYVPRQGEPPTPAPATGGSASPSPTATAPTPAAPLDLNEATENELDTLPGVGPATAKAIVDYRTEHGPFSSVDDLLDVRGIGPAKLDGFRALVRVG